MDNLNQSNARADFNNQKSHVSEAASELLKEGKKLASELYNEGMHKVTDVEENMKEYSDKLMLKVKENPLTSVLIAGGIGFLLSKILK
ncbi:MAG TPA: hypothetical protein PK657_00710 [Legionella sp.]|nr:hypothetical protein [Legionella sp.]